MSIHQSIFETNTDKTTICKLAYRNSFHNRDGEYDDVEPNYGDEDISIDDSIEVPSGLSYINASVDNAATPTSGVDVDAAAIVGAVDGPSEMAPAKEEEREDEEDAHRWYESDGGIYDNQQLMLLRHCKKLELNLNEEIRLLSREMNSINLRCDNIIKTQHEIRRLSCSGSECEQEDGMPVTQQQQQQQQHQPQQQHEMKKQHHRQISSLNVDIRETTSQLNKRIEDLLQQSTPESNDLYEPVQSPAFLPQHYLLQQ